MALKKFEGMQTEWGGLWYHPETRSYRSTTINLALLREFKGNVSLVVRHNWYFEKGSDKPKFIFALRDSKAQDSIELKARGVDWSPYYDYATGSYYTEDDEKLYTESEALSMLEQMKSDLMYGESPDDCVPSFYLKGR